MRDADLVEHPRRPLGGGHRSGTDEDGLARLVARCDVLGDRLELAVEGLVDQVALVLADQRHVGGDRHDLQVVGAGQLGRLGGGGTGHAGELVVHAEVVLEGDGGEGLVLLLDLHALLGLDRLVEAFGPAPALEHSTGELVDDLHLAVDDDVVLVAEEQLLGAERHRELVHQVLGDAVVEVLDLERGLDPFDALLGGDDGALLLVDLVVLVTPQAAGDGGELVVQLRGVGRPSGDDQRGAGLVDEDGVDLVDDGEVEATLDLTLTTHGHVVAEVVEAELVVDAVGDVGGVLDSLVVRFTLAGDDEPHAEPEPLEQPAHPLRLERGQVLVDRDDVRALAREPVQVERQGRGQGLALTGLHLGDPAEVEGGATHHLDVEVALTQHPLRGLAGDGEGIEQDVVEVLALLETLTERRRLRLELSVAHGLVFRLQGIDVGHQSLQRPQALAFTGFEYAIE